MANKIEEIADKHFPVDPPLKSGYRNPEQEGANISAKAALRELLEECCKEVVGEITRNQAAIKEFLRTRQDSMRERAQANANEAQRILARLRALGGE